MQSNVVHEVVHVQPVRMLCGLSLLFALVAGSSQQGERECAWTILVQHVARSCVLVEAPQIRVVLIVDATHI